MGEPKKIQACFKKLYEKIEGAKEISEEDVRIAFVKSGILEELGYELYGLDESDKEVIEEFLERF